MKYDKKRIYKNEKRFFHKILPQHNLQVSVEFQTTVHEADAASQHADGSVIECGDGDGDWNTRIFKISKGKSAPVVQSESYENKDPFFEEAVSKTDAVEKEKKKKKGKVPCSKEKRGRIR